MIFVSQRPNNDPKPYVDLVGIRSAHPTLCNLDPRPEFTQTNDPLPWAWYAPNGTFSGRSSGQYSALPGDDSGWSSRFDPRHDEFDPPVNPILAAFRADHPETPAESWLEALDHPFECIPEVADAIEQALQDAIGPNPEGYGHVGAWNWDYEHNFPKREAWQDHARRVLSKLAALA